jgi:hypothetical protein
VVTVDRARLTRTGDPVEKVGTLICVHLKRPATTRTGVETVASDATERVSRFPEAGAPPG